MRLKGRYISRESILESFPSYEILEAYPTDKYLPSYLVYAEFQGKAFHILLAADLKGDNVRVVTAYHPASDEWEDDYRRRRRLK
jgi:hypothetical protein